MNGATNEGCGGVLLTPKQVQDRCGVSRSTFYRMVNNEGLKVVRWAGMVRVAEKDLVAWIERHTE
jgi:excisionase family DNA binding protein